MQTAITKEISGPHADRTTKKSATHFFLGAFVFGLPVFFCTPV